MTAQYVEHRFEWPEVWNTKADEDGWPAHIEAVLRRDAVEAGVSLIGAPERVGEPERITVDTDGGPVKALRGVYRAAVSAPVSIVSATVEAVEVTPGVWAALVPAGVPIVNIRHGLDTYEVDVDAEDVNGQPTGYHGPFVPVSPEEVEVVPGATTHRLLVTLVEQDDPRIAEAEYERDHGTNDDPNWGA